jgi:hypothetical protein
MTNPGPTSFDEYCAEHRIAQDEMGPAFAAYLHELSEAFLGGEPWDGEVTEFDPADPLRGAKFTCLKCAGMDLPKHHRTCAKASSP